MKSTFYVKFIDQRVIAYVKYVREMFETEKMSLGNAIPNNRAGIMMLLNRSLLRL